MREQPEMKEPKVTPDKCSPDTAKMYSAIDRWDKYQKHIDSLRTIPCSENNWKDGQELEEGKDYEIKPRLADGFFVKGSYDNKCVFCGKIFHNTDKLWFCCQDCANELLAVPIIQETEESQDEIHKNIREAVEVIKKKGKARSIEEVNGYNRGYYDGYERARNDFALPVQETEDELWNEVKEILKESWVADSFIKKLKSKFTIKRKQ